jgi:23S rRNA pseudouridine2605 synthase
MRRYRARARGRTDQARLDKLKDGITVEGIRYGAIDARLDKVKQNPDGTTPANVWITLTLAEGKNREVRRVLEALGLTVNRLIRLSYGPFQLGVLGQGQVEEIGPRVIREQLVGLIAPQNMPLGDKVVELHQPGIQPRRPAGHGPKSEGAVLPSAIPKMQYKAGWAKPKHKAPFKGKAKTTKGPTVISAKSSTKAPTRNAQAFKPKDDAPRAGPAKAAKPKAPRSQASRPSAAKPPAPGPQARKPR